MTIHGSKNHPPEELECVEGQVVPKEAVPEASLVRDSPGSQFNWSAWVEGNLKSVVSPLSWFHTIFLSNSLC